MPPLPLLSASFLKELEKLRDYKVVHTLVPAIIWSEKIARNKSKKLENPQQSAEKCAENSVNLPKIEKCTKDPCSSAKKFLHVPCNNTSLSKPE